VLQSEKVKLPDWVTLPSSDKKGAIKNPDKLRRNRPAEEVVAEEPKVESEEVEAPEAEVAEEVVAEEVVAEAPASEEPVAAEASEEA
jgi:hypothetical protein